VRIRPLIPRREARFAVGQVGSDLVAFKKIDSGHVVTVPLIKIRQVYPVDDRGSWAVEIDGRIQWRDTDERWGYLAEAPGDPFGVPRDVKMDAASVRQLEGELKARGNSLQWQRADDAAAEADTWSVVYDGDGFYLRQRDREFDQVLVKRPAR